MMDSVSVVVRQEGIRGLWRGNLINCARTFPSRGILFSCQDQYKDMLLKAAGEDPGLHVVETTVYRSDGSSFNVPTWASFIAGSMAGITACSLTYPLDVLWTRVAGKLVARSVQEAPLASTFRTMVKEEGARAFFRGVGPTILGAVPYEGVKFAVYDSSIAMQNSMGVDQQTHPLLPKLAAGFLAGGVAGSVLFPNDTVRRLLQMREVQYTSAMDCWVRTYRTHGVRRFFRGLTPYLVRVLPNSAIQFGAYNLLKTAFEDEHRDSRSGKNNQL